MSNDVFSFYELVQKYTVKIPIIQRDYAQGRRQNLQICENFLKALKESILSKNQINLDFIYGNVDDGIFLPLDGQQRLTTLFLLHWYAYVKEGKGNEVRTVLKKFSYETRLSSRRFCEALLDNPICSDSSYESIGAQIQDSKWFYISWKNDSTIRSMLRSIDLIHETFKDIDNIWESLTDKRTVVFHLLILEDFGLSDDLYIKMNARGRLLTPFENFKAEIQDKSDKGNWENDQEEFSKFCYKIDGDWTQFLWDGFRKNNSVDNAHMNLITTIVMAKLSTGQLLKGSERIDTIRKLNDNNSDRDLIRYIDQDTFDYIYKVYNLYCKLFNTHAIPTLNMVLWRHEPDQCLLNQILVGINTSYTHKVLFFAQTEYLLKNTEIRQDKFEEWMRVIRNIVSRADLTADGKRSDIIRSPETFYGAINLINELANGCTDIYSYLSSNTIASSFAREQVREEILKAKILELHPEYKQLIFKTEDNELLRGRITFALECAGYKSKIEQIDFNLLSQVQTVFDTYFNKELDSGNLEFDKLRRAMLTIKVRNKYCYYNYWWSFWYAGNAEKRKLFPLFREIEYFIGSDEFKPYFRELINQLLTKNYDEIISNFSKPQDMENWQYRLIKEADLLFNCSTKYIAITEDHKSCYLLKGKRPSDTSGSKLIQ